MAEMHKLTKNGETIYPATTTDSVVHPELQTSLTSLINEYNVSLLYPTGGLENTDKYDLETAVSKLDSVLKSDQKTIGTKLAFISNDNGLEEFTYTSGNFNNTSSWSQGSGSGGNKILEWAGDVASTRKQVILQDRKKLLQISYTNDNGEIVNEQYKSTNYTDTEWVKDSNWEQIPNQNQLKEIKEQLPKTITYDYNSFKESNTGVFLWQNNSLKIFSSDCSTTRLINIEGCKKIHLISKTANNSSFKPFAFYDSNGILIIPDYYSNSFHDQIDVEIIPPENVKYAEFRSLTSFTEFKAEIYYPIADNIKLEDKIESNSDSIDFINQGLADKEVRINEDKVKANVTVNESITYNPMPKGILKDIYIPIKSNDSDFYVTLLENIGKDETGNLIMNLYQKIKIEEGDIFSEDDAFYIQKTLNVALRTNTYLYLSSTKAFYFYTVKNYNNELILVKSKSYGNVFSVVQGTRPIYYKATIQTKESLVDLSNSVNETKESIDNLNTSVENLNTKVKQIETNTANVANINDSAPSNSETYSSQKIEDRIAEIQNASANVQVVNSEGNSTTNAISQAAATLSLGKRVKVFTNVAAMKADATLKEGMSCQTLGYYNSEDGGHALYVIKSGELTEDKGSIIALNNGLFASLIFDGVINVKQWGWNTDFVTPFYGIIPYDITDTLNRIMNYIRTNNLQGRTSSSIIYFPKGFYYIGESIALGSNIILEGQSGAAYGPDKTNSSVIITDFPGTVFTGSRFYLRRLTFLGAYKSTTAENDTYVASSPKEISYCSIGGYDYVCESLTSVGEIAHCVAWLMGKGIVKSKVNDSLIHHNLLTGSCWNKNQNCETTAIVLGGSAAACISDNYIDFWTYGIRGVVQMTNIMIANNTIDYCAVGIHVEGCEGCTIQGNNFYHINKSTTGGSGVITNYPEDSTWRTTPWCCVNVGSTTKSLSVMGNIARGSDVFMQGNKATELYAYGNMVRGCGSKYSEQNLQSDVCFVDNKDVEI